MYSIQLHTMRQLEQLIQSSAFPLHSPLETQTVMPLCGEGEKEQLYCEGEVFFTRIWSNKTVENIILRRGAKGGLGGNEIKGFFRIIEGWDCNRLH